MTNQRHGFVARLWIVAALVISSVGQSGCDLEQSPEQSPGQSSDPTAISDIPDYAQPPQNVLIGKGVTISTEHGTVFLENALMTRGGQGQAFVDQQTGKLAWPALTCANPECIEQGSRDGPFYFTHSIPGAKLDDEGYVIPPRRVKKSRLDVTCPICGRPNDVQEYVLPEAVRRTEILDAELQASRATVRALSSGESLPDDVRAPTEIHRERALLPRMYVVPD